MSEDLSWPYYQEHPIVTNRKVSVKFNWPWEFTGFLTWLHHAGGGEMRERRYAIFRLCGIQIEYSWQWLPDDAAEDLLQFIQEEQAAGEDFDSEYYDPTEDLRLYDGGDGE